MAQLVDSGRTGTLEVTAGARPSALEAGTAFQVGAVLAGRFRVDRFIARGGMGEVYEAHDVLLGERVALKTIAHGGRDEVHAARFRREIQLARKVTHPNVCRIFEVGVHRDGTAFVVMQLLEGETLRELLQRRGRLSTEEALPLVRDMAAGLSAAQAAGVVHRDFKPGNVLVVPGADRLRAVVTDFGIAEQADEVAAAPVAGTPPYMAPEQLAGERAGVPADIYAFGAVLHEMTTGELPRPADGGAGPWRSPRSLAPALDARWEQVILRCLARDPAQRFASATEAAAALSAPDAVASPAPARMSRRRVVGAALAVVVAVGAGAAWLASRAKPAPAALVEPGTEPRIAVVGFGGEPPRTEPWLGGAATELVASALTEGGALRVVPGAAIARAKKEIGWSEPDSESPAAVRRLGANLRATHLVAGAHARAGGVELSVLDARTGERTASVRAEGGSSDILDVLLRAGRELRRRFGATASFDERRARASLPHRPQALRPYLEGLHALRASDARGALEPLQRAAALEPTHAPTLAALSDAWDGVGDEARARESAKSAMEQARGLSREEQLAIEARYRELAREWDRAVELRRMLSELFPRDPNYGTRLVQVLTKSGRSHEAIATAERLRRDPVHADDPRLLLVLGGTLAWVGRMREGLSLTARAATLATHREAWGVVAHACLTAAMLATQIGVGHLPAVRSLLTEAMTLYERAGQPLEVGFALDVLGVAHLFSGEVRAAEEAHTRAAEIFHRLGHPDREDAARARAAADRLERGEIAAAEVEIRKALALHRAAGHATRAAWHVYYLGRVQHARGDLDGAERAQQESLARNKIDERLTAFAQRSLGLVRLERDDLAGALEALRRVEQWVTRGRLTQSLFFGTNQADIAEVLLESGRPDEALRVTRRALAEVPRDNPLTPVLLLATASWSEHALGHARRALSLAERALTAARGVENVAVRQKVEVFAARVLSRSGAAAKALALADENLARARKLGLPGWALHARLARTWALRGLGRTAEADRLAAAVAADAERQGYRLVARKARAR